MFCLIYFVAIYRNLLLLIENKIKISTTTKNREYKREEKKHFLLIKIINLYNCKLDFYSKFSKQRKTVLNANIKSD